VTSKQNILIIGGGGREHALAWKLSQSPLLGKLYMAPGNGGTESVATTVPITPMDASRLIEFAKSHDIGLTVVGPDDVLASGMVDQFQAASLRIFGPTKRAAQIESSKAFAKELMTTSHIPTAAYATFTDLQQATKYVDEHACPIVIKASGLALGKGVYVCATRTEAAAALHEIMTTRRFGEAGDSVVIEEFMTGQEVSIQALSDGHSSLLLPPSQDHKRIGEGDTGPNTGGMGTFSPVPWVTKEQLGRIQSTIVDPALKGLASRGAPFQGLLYPGLMIDGPHVKVVEFNARFGDPETQSYLRLLETDLLELLNACVDQDLSTHTVTWSAKSSVCVVLASGGYPGTYETGLPITGLEQAERLPDVVVFHAGTSLADGHLVTSGGRVLNVTATGHDLAEARDKAYAAVKLIHFDGMQYRTDIGMKALAS
jgi:phosphoribosylamine--glycine ligase